MFRSRPDEAGVAKSNELIRRFRTIFLSDLHLGTRGCQAELALDFLRHNEADTYFLVAAARRHPLSHHAGLLRRRVSFSQLAAVRRISCRSGFGPPSWSTIRSAAPAEAGGAGVVRSAAGQVLA